MRLGGLVPAAVALAACLPQAAAKRDNFQNHMRAALAVPHAVFPRQSGSSPTFIGNGTTPTGTATASASASATTGTGSAPSPTDYPTSCGVDSSPFTVKIEQTAARGLLDGWFVKLSGTGFLATPSGGGASRFAVEETGHLCAVGRTTEAGGVRVAAVEDVGSTAVLWLASVAGLEHSEDEDEDFALRLAPVGCAVGAGGEIRCVEGSGGDEGGLDRWVNCGLQLALTAREGDVVQAPDGRNCTSIKLVAV